MCTPIGEPEVLLLLTQYPLDLHQGVVFWLQLLVVATQDGTLQLVQILLQFLLILQTQLLRDNLAVTHRIHFSLHVSHVVVLEGACRAEKVEKLFIAARVLIHKWV